MKSRHARLDVYQMTTAYHEAGHAVVAHRVGASIEEMYIYRTRGTGDWSEWKGEVKLTRDSIDLAHSRRVAAAGPLAEAKCLAEWQYGDEVQFDDEKDFRRLASRLLSHDYANLEYEVFGFVVDGMPVTAGIILLDDDIDKVKIQPAPSADEIANILAELAGELDDMPVWHAVTRLADKLCESKIDTIQNAGADVRREIKVLDVGSLIDSFLEDPACCFWRSQSNQRQ